MSIKLTLNYFIVIMSALVGAINHKPKTAHFILKEPVVTCNEDKLHAFQFLGPCLAGDVAHAKVLQALIDAGSITHEKLGITPDDMAIFHALSRIANPRERAITAFRGCREGNVFANFGVIQHLLLTSQIKLDDLREGDDGILKVGSDLSYFSNEHATQLERILPSEEPPQD